MNLHLKNDRYDTKLHLMVRLQFAISGECEVLLHDYYSLFHSDLKR